MGRTIRVKPLPESAKRAGSRNDWQVLISGSRTQKYPNKYQAEEYAKSVKKSADKLIVHKQNGSVDYRREGLMS